MTFSTTAPAAAVISRLRGTMTALATPMLDGGAIDWPSVDRLVEVQLAAGIEVLVVNGSTAEAATLSGTERHALLRRVVERARGRALVVAGTGHSSTAATAEEQRAAHDIGADVALVVTPPYNRPSDEGLWRHYRAVAAASPLPILLYNVPSRTGRALSLACIARLASLDAVVGIKDADADVSRVAQLRRMIDGPFALLSGDDNTAAAYCAVGGDGLISVASNVVPAPMRTLIDAALAGARDRVIAQAQRLMPLLSALGLDSNPIPVKAALALQSGTDAHYRLPLCAASDATLQALAVAMRPFR